MTTGLGRVVTAGVDVGSAAVKVVVVESQGGRDGEVRAAVMQRIRRRDLHEVVVTTYDEALARAGVTTEEVDYVATTGEADSVEFRTGHFYNMTTHARGALFLVPEARGVIDVGALHARAIRMDERGRVLAHRMTSQCASGSGQFLENIARYLGVPVDDVGRLSREARTPEVVSSICAVLAETDVINMVARGITTPDILKGIHLSIAGRLVQLARAIGASGTLAVSGGLSQDEGMIEALREQASAGSGNRKRSALKLMEVEFIAHPMAIHAGALGAALLGAWRQEQLVQAGKWTGRAAEAAATAAAEAMA